LNSLVGKRIRARILDANKKENKLIFSEKEAIKDGLAERFAELKIGDVVTGVVTGVVDFGVFVNVDGIEGLVHISEVKNERIASVSDFYKEGDTMWVKCLGTDNRGKIKLSAKRVNQETGEDLEKSI
jgi:ribosomal protein S1